MKVTGVTLTQNLVLSARSLSVHALLRLLHQTSSSGAAFLLLGDGSHLWMTLDLSWKTEA